MKRVLQYKYPGSVLDHKLTFDTIIKAIQGKGRSRIYCLRKYGHLEYKPAGAICICNFYRCFIRSILTFDFLNWFRALSLINRNVLKRIVNVCVRIVGVRQMSVSGLRERQVTRKAKMIVMDPGHILATHY